MKIELLILLYAYVCICVVLFDLFFAVQVFYHNRRAPERKQQIWTEISMQLEEQLPAGQAFLRRLSKIQSLIALNELSQEHPAQVKHWAEHNVLFLLDLGRVYSKRPQVQKAFYTYLLAQLQLGQKPKNGANASEALQTLQAMLVDMMQDSSVYVRENALKALLDFGSPTAVFNAVLCINQVSEHQNEKLLSDHLLEYKGNQSELSTLLWNSFSKLSSTVQVSFVNYLRRLPQDAVEQKAYYQPLYVRMKNHATDKELRLAILRYFRRYEYAPAQEEMIRMVEDPSELHWEYAAVAASCVTDCLGVRARNALLGAMKSSNWYLRLNATETLLGMGVQLNPEELRKDDRYAADMLYYRMQINQINE